MKSVSQRYKASMRSPLRNRGYCVITLGNIDITAITDGAWSSPSEQYYSSFQTIDYDHAYGDPVADLGLNRWTLDGTFDIVDGQNDGFVYASQSNASGVIPSVFSNVLLEKTFTQNHTLSGVTITWGDVNFLVRVQYMDEDGNLIAETIEGVTSNKTEIELTGDGVRIVRILSYGCLPLRYPRIYEIMWGIAQVFTDDRIISLAESNDVDPLSRRLPEERVEFTVTDYDHTYDPDNPVGQFAFINKGAKIQVQFGYDLGDTTEWLKPDLYSLQDRPTFQDGLVTFVGTGLVGSLSDMYYKSRYGTKTLYEMAEGVLQDANLIPLPSGADPWDIDDSLRNMQTTAILPIDTHMNCLQMIAHAARCRMYTDDDNVIHLTPFGVTLSGIYSGEYTDNGHAWWSSWDGVDNGVEPEATYATLELNRWTLGSDSPFVIIPEVPEKEGFVSSGSDGTGKSEVIFSRSFDINHDLPVVSLHFDPVLGRYPFELLVYYYSSEGTTNLETDLGALITDENGNALEAYGATVYNSEVIHPDSSEVSILTPNTDDCSRVEVHVTGTLPYERARVSHVFFRETDYSLTLNDTIEKTEVTSKIEKLRNVTVAEYSYTRADSDSTLYDGYTDLTELHVEIPLSWIADVQVDGADYIDFLFYPNAIDIFGMPAGTKHIVITGRQLTENSAVHTYAVNATGDDDIEENPLITNQAMADALADHITKYLALRNTYDREYRGNPELEVGDIIGLETMFSDSINGLILVDELRYKGSWSGSLKVKGLL